MVRNKTLGAISGGTNAGTTVNRHNVGARGSFRIKV